MDGLAEAGGTHFHGYGDERAVGQPGGNRGVDLDGRAGTGGQGAEVPGRLFAQVADVGAAGGRVRLGVVEVAERQPARDAQDDPHGGQRRGGGVGHDDVGQQPPPGTDRVGAGGQLQLHGHGGQHGHGLRLAGIKFGAAVMAQFAVRGQDRTGWRGGVDGHGRGAQDMRPRRQ